MASPLLWFIVHFVAVVTGAR